MKHGLQGTRHSRLCKSHHLSPLLGSLQAGMLLTMDTCPARLGDNASCLLLEGTSSISHAWVHCLSGSTACDVCSQYQQVSEACHPARRSCTCYHQELLALLCWLSQQCPADSCPALQPLPVDTLAMRTRALRMPIGLSHSHSLIRSARDCLPHLMQTVRKLMQIACRRS